MSFWTKLAELCFGTAAPVKGSVQDVLVASYVDGTFSRHLSGFTAAEKLARTQAAANGHFVAALADAEVRIAERVARLEKTEEVYTSFITQAQTILSLRQATFDAQASEKAALAKLTELVDQVRSLTALVEGATAPAPAPAPEAQVLGLQPELAQDTQAAPAEKPAVAAAKGKKTK